MKITQQNRQLSMSTLHSTAFYPICVEYVCKLMSILFISFNNVNTIRLKEIIRHLQYFSFTIHKQLAVIFFLDACLGIDGLPFLHVYRYRAIVESLTISSLSSQPL